MKDIKTKLIYYYLLNNKNNNRKRNNKGFTLLELLIVVVILGILSAIGLPSLLNQTYKVKETEAQNNLSAFGKYQQIYYLENGQFSNSFDALGLGNITDANPETKYYQYQLEEYITNTRIKIRATPKDSQLKEFLGGVRRETNSLGIPVLINLGCKNNEPGISNLSINIMNGTCTNGEKLYGNGV